MTKKLILILLLNLLFSSNYTHAIDLQSKIIITEIHPDSNKALEWVEIFNQSSESINFESGRFVTHGVQHYIKEARGGYILAPQTVAIFAQDATTLLSGNSIPDGVIVFDTTWSSISTAGDISAKDNSGNILGSHTLISSSNHVGLIDGAMTNEIISSIGVYPNTPKINNPNNQNTSQIVIPDKIRLNELFPAPKTDGDFKEEYIEIINSGATADLSNVFLKNSKGQIYNRTGDTISSGSAKTYYYSLTNIQLRNDGDTIDLVFRNPETGDETILDSVTYPKASFGQSYSFDSANNIWVWSSIPSPDRPNTIITINNPPKLLVAVSDRYIKTGEVFSIDARESTDEDGDELLANWNMGDNSSQEGLFIQHMYQVPNTYKVVGVLSDGKDSVTKELNIYVSQAKNSTTSDSGASTKPATKKTTEKTSKTSTWWPSFDDIFDKYVLPINEVIDYYKNLEKEKIALDKAMKVKTNSTKVKESAEMFSLVGRVLIPPGVITDYSFLLLDEQNKIRYIQLQKGSWSKITENTPVKLEITEKDLDLATIKLKKNNYMTIENNDIEFKNTEAISSSIFDLFKEYNSEKITIEGVVTKKNGSYVTLDDGTGEILVRAKSAILKDGLRAKIEGYLFGEKDYLVIFPALNGITILNTEQKNDQSKVITESPTDESMWSSFISIFR